MATCNLPFAYGRFDLTTYIPGLSDYEIMCRVLARMNEIEQLVPLSVITYANPIQWNITTQYAQNTVVIDPATGTAYLAVQPVPAGVLIDNTEYWIPIFSLEDLVNEYKNAITNVTLQSGQPAGREIVQGQLFWIEDTLYQATTGISADTTVVPGSSGNCDVVTVDEKLRGILAMPTAFYRASDTSINMAFQQTPGQVVVAGDVHTYDRANQTIKIEGR